MKIIIRNCNVAELDIPLKYATKLYNEFAIRHPNAFYLRTRQRGMQNWDGKIKYITKTGQFKIGLLPSVYKRCIELGIKPIIVDMRQPLPKVSKVVTQIGKYKLRPEQEKAVKAILSNKLGETPFQIGVLDYTVNAGKTLIMSALYLSYKKQLKTLLITNDSDWLNQARDEFKQYLPGEDITFVQGKVLNWSNFTIGMVQSISRNMKYYQNELAKIDMVLIDEADQGGSKQYQNVITRLFNTRVRIGLSGTIYMSRLAKDKVKNMNLRCFFGDVLAEFKLKDSIKKGYSTKTIVKTVEGKPWFGNWESDCMSYNEIYDDSITHNKIAWTMALDRLKWNLNQGRYPALVVCKHIAHCENLCKFFKKKLDNKYNIACVHVNTHTKLRQQIMKDFREGKIDILVSTTIIARGKNFPKLRYLLNTASMDSQEKSIQFLGRLVRKDESKSKVYLDDLHYPGNYLSRHGNHRRKYYQDQGLKVIRLSKLWDKYPRHKPFQG
nr:MAG: U3 small nucleolar RNA-associated SSU processome protein 25 [Bacteriophage sp.]